MFVPTATVALSCEYDMTRFWVQHWVQLIEEEWRFQSASDVK